MLLASDGRKRIQHFLLVLWVWDLEHGDAMDSVSGRHLGLMDAKRCEIWCFSMKLSMLYEAEKTRPKVPLNSLGELVLFYAEALGP